MDLTYAITALGTSFGDVGGKIIIVGILAFSAVAGTGLVYAGLRFILSRFGIGNANLNLTNSAEIHHYTKNKKNKKSMRERFWDNIDERMEQSYMKYDVD